MPPPWDHAGNTANGNAVGKLCDNLPVGPNDPGRSTLRGRITGLRIFEIDYSVFSGSTIAGKRLDEVVKSIKKNDALDAESGHRQRTDHDDRDGNLPDAPGNGVVYREYHLPDNKFPTPAYIRLVADLRNKRLYITPTHYDVWLPDPQAARTANVQHPINPTLGVARNPFYLLRNPSRASNLFY